MAQKSMLSFINKHERNIGDEVDFGTETVQQEVGQEQVPCKRQPSVGTIKGHKLFQHSWCLEFPWLETETIGGKTLMRCKFCCKAGSNIRNAFTKGCADLQKSALKRHMLTEDHKTASAVKKTRACMQQFIREGIEEKNSSLVAQLKSVYYLAIEEIPSRKFLSLVELQRENGCEALMSPNIYKHSDNITAMENALAKTVRDGIKQMMSDSPFLALVLDETVNVVVRKKLIVFTRFTVDGRAVTKFLGNYTVTDGKADTIVSKLENIIQDHQLDVAKLIGLGSDGAAVMTGRLSGVGVRMKQNTNPFLTHVHCITHRVALATGTAGKTDRIQRYKRTVNSVFNFFKYSAVRYERLRELNRILENDDYVSLKEPCSVRWLSLSRAVDGIKSNWPALIMELDEEVSARANATARGLLQEMKTYHFIYITYMLTDVLGIMNRLNLTFQREDVHIGTIQPMVNSTINLLRDMLRTPGEAVQEFQREFDVQQGIFQGMQLTYADPGSIEAAERATRNFIDALIDNLQQRFPEDAITLIQHLDTLLCVQRYPAADADILQYGQDALEAVIGCLGQAQETTNGTILPALLNMADLRREFQAVKLTLRGHGLTTFEDVCHLLITQYNHIYPEFSKLAAYALTIPVSSVVCERGFSIQNRIHHGKRSLLGEDRLNNLMLLTMDGPSLPQMDYGHAAQVFRDASKRRKV